MSCCKLNKHNPIFHEPGCNGCDQCFELTTIVEKIGEAVGVTDSLPLKKFASAILRKIERMKVPESPTKEQPYINSGTHLGAVRTWIKWNCKNGERVTWGSNDSVGELTVAQLEEIAQRVSEAVKDE